ncbi:cbb3-type cytochrome oxidase assembly protein CcoS [Thiomicrorhabdus xiamenensis]|uniref:Cbb3-type cytochrome oxidase assembly protein CcoS n=1 Tax=Thiomicrorhabdus xiamenensis TaxID=2739063 RepID=A0A7D4SHG6_9GAMM|nr:cbb3-type cytochrome oxidase assembly protein CcoS [Thiomicrorhabdus xiamenensis]QKI88260.1 cbb3-type cytochrome oxidase assembly protein CcoS [Thiomicrorhabdus xiamenensis]
MDVIYGLIPMMLFFGFLVVVVFIWMAKKGYFDDMDGQANRILMDDDDFQPTAKQEKGDESEASPAEQGTETEQSKGTPADK